MIGIFVIGILLYMLVRNTGNTEINPKTYLIDK